MDKHKDLLIGFLIFVLELGLFYYYWKNNLILTIAFLAISALVLSRWANKEEKFLYFTGFLLGPVFDLILVQTGVWNYGNPTIFRVPAWLPFAYGLGTVMIVKIGKSLAKLVVK